MHGRGRFLRTGGTDRIRHLQSPLPVVRWSKQRGWLSLQEFADLVAMAAIFAVCLVLLRKTKLSPVLVMLLAGAVNLLLPA